MALYTTIQNVAPPMEGGHWDVSAQSEGSHVLRILLSLAIAEDCGQGVVGGGGGRCVRGQV